jgi:RNA polymerase sigma-70 factor, ECF subfamily
MQDPVVKHTTFPDLTMKQFAQCDERLVSAAKSGCPTAFAELRSIYSQPLYSTIIRITKNREDAEDALQDTFLRAYLSLRNFEGRSSLSSWLTRIAINSALMILRKRRIRAEISVDSPSNSASDISQFEIRDSAPNPEQICDQRQRYMYVRRAIQGLEPMLRAAMESHVMQGCSLREIARVLEISEAAAKSRLYRARLRLGARPLGSVRKNTRPKQSPKPRDYAESSE